jgi:hypothetical protein
MKKEKIKEIEEWQDGIRSFEESKKIISRQIEDAETYEDLNDTIRNATNCLLIGMIELHKIMTE